MDKYWSSMVKRTEPYVPGLQLNKQDIIKLNTNENPYPPSPKVKEAIQEEMDRSLQLYPSPTADELRETIGSTFNLEKENVFIGNGSDEVLAFSFMAFFEPGKRIRYPNITYSFYPVYAKIFNISYEEVAVKDDFRLPIEQFFNAEGGVILPNPNAPTSIYEPITVIEEIVKNNAANVVIIDEAYIDFAGASAASLVEKYENLLVVQTTSKSRSLAGLRVGFALGNPSLIEALMRIKDSFNSYTIDRLALVGAKAAFLDDAYFKDRTNTIISTREKVSKQLEALQFNVLPSGANFLFVRHQKFAAADLYEALLEENVLVRHFKQNGINNYLRITIGTEEQMNTFLSKLEKVM